MSKIFVDPTHGDPQDVTSKLEELTVIAQCPKCKRAREMDLSFEWSIFLNEDSVSIGVFADCECGEFITLYEID